MPKRTLDVTDTFSSPSEPIIPITVTNQLGVFADDTAFETAKGSAGVAGDIYFNSTDNKIRYNDGTGWREQENELNNSTGFDPVVGDDNTQGYSIGSVWINTTSDDIFIAADVSTGAAVWQQVNGGGGGGEINTASNQGAGSQVFKQKTGVDLEFRTLTEGNNITLTQNADDIEISSSGGAGSLNTVLQITNEINDDAAANWTSGNNVNPIAGGGTLQGTFTDETVGELAGIQSYNYTQAAGSLNDFVLSPIKPVALRSRSQMGLAQWKHTYDGNDGDIRFIVIDTTNSNILLSKTLDAGTSVLCQQDLLFFPSNIANIRCGYQVLVENSGAVLIFDDIEIDDRPGAHTAVSLGTDWESYTPTFTGFGSPSSVDFSFRQVGDSVEIHGFFVSGTSTATEAQITLPSGFSIDANKVMSTKLVGVLAESTVESTMFSVLATGGDNYLNFAFQAIDGTNPLNGNAFTANGRTMIFFCTVPIAEATTQDFIITQETKAVNQFNARIDNNGSASIASEDINVIASVNRSSVGRVDVTLNTGEFTVAPAVNATPIDNNNRDITINNITTTGFRVDINDTSTFSGRDDDFFLEIKRQGSDYRSPLTPRLNINPIAHVSNTQATGVAGGASTTSYSTLTLNTVIGDGFVSLSANQMTLLPGRYKVFFKCPGFRIGDMKAKIRNITDSTDDIIGDNAFTDPAGGQSFSIVQGELDINSTKVYELQMIGGLVKAGDGFGKANNFAGDSEIHASGYIEKLR